MNDSRLLTHEELKKDKSRKLIRNVNIEHKESLTGLEKFAVLITDKVGSMGVFIIICVWTFVWIGWNTLGPKEYRFDPFPAFVLWLFLSNML